MDTTYIFYSFLLVFMVLLSLPLAELSSSSKAVKVNYTPEITSFIIVMYALVIGMRYNVGKDYGAYLGWYKELFRFGHFKEEKEIGYVLLNEVLYWLNAHYAFLFISLAFLQIFFLYKSLEKFKFIIPWYIFFFFTSLLMFSSMNIMRQTLVYFIFFYCINLMNDKKYVRATLYFFFALSFHSSILLVAWVYPLLKFDWFKSRVIQIGLLIFITVLSSYLLQFALSSISPLTDLLGNYQYYIDNSERMEELTIENANGLGFGKYMWFIIDFIIVIYSTKLKEEFKNYSFFKYYNLYFLGALLERMLGGNFIFARTNDYFLNFRVLMLSFLCFYLFKVKRQLKWNLAIGGFIILVMTIFFYRGIYNSAAQCAPFQSIFSE